MGRETDDQFGACEALTEKEREALVLVYRNFTSKEIARELNISPRSVNHRIDNARQKLGVATRQEAARLLVEDGESITGAPLTVPKLAPDPADRTGVEGQPQATFRDSGRYVQRAPWSDRFSFLDPAPGVRPDQLSKRRRASLIVELSVKIALVLLIMLGVASGIEEAFFS